MVAKGNLSDSCHSIKIQESKNSIEKAGLKMTIIIIKKNLPFCSLDFLEIKKLNTSPRTRCKMAEPESHG